MSSFTLTIHVGDVVHVLTVIEAAFDNPEPFMQDVLLVMVRSTQQNFVAQGRPDRWSDLAESTVARRFARAMKGKGSKKLGSLAVLGAIEILRDTGILAQSVGFGASGPFSTSQGFGEADKTSAVIGTNAPGWQNQFPDSRGRRVARVFILWQVQDEEDVGEMGIHFFTRTGAYAA